MGRMMVVMGDFGCVLEENPIFGEDDFCCRYEFAQNEHHNLMVEASSS
jgi:hypothetical protein